MNEPNNRIWLHISFFYFNDITSSNNLFKRIWPTTSKHDYCLCYSKVRMLNRKYSSVARYSK